VTTQADAIERLHPSLVHHIVNSLGWPGLRPLQAAAVEPVLDGLDALLLAPTAGGKTEAAVFPVLSAISRRNTAGLTVLYVCPIKALLNNLEPRLARYADWLGRRVALWHGDVDTAARQRILRDPPDLLLTTPESIESMLVSTKVDHRRLFADLRTVIVDEVHAFAGDDRGWHLLAVLERITKLAGRPVQRIGLSATVGNPEELLDWLQGSNRLAGRPARVVAPDVAADADNNLQRATRSTSAQPIPPNADIELDYVGGVTNAAKVIGTLHRGEKRLVFCDSRQIVEELGEALRTRGVTTYLSHASLSLDERRRAEAAFADGRDCVIVATSTLELGIDVGDLDRVIQINAPSTVAAFLQRLGRSGRRAGSRRNCLFLALNEDALVQAAALLMLWSRGYVEPVVPPPDPRHIAAQQLIALCLQEHRVGENLWAEWWNGLNPFSKSAEPVARYLVEEGFLDRDGGMLFVGPQAEKHFGRRHFMEMTTVFTASPQFTVLSGRTEIGQVDPMLLTEQINGPRILLLGGRSWTVTWIDWRRKHCFVEPAEGGGKARWNNAGNAGAFPATGALVGAMREVLLGAQPPVSLTQRAAKYLGHAREVAIETVHPGGSVITRTGHDVRWWTWAGWKANATLTATLAGITDETQRFDECSIRLRNDLTPQLWNAATGDATERICLPNIDERALKGLKFNAALPDRLAVATLAARLADPEGATTALTRPVRFSAF
jgi:ATP-dependent Lhr-like helicase